MNARDFGQRLRACRVAQGKTQEQVARAAGVTRGAIAQWEAGDVGRIGAEEVRAAARYLATTLDHLIDGSPQVAEPVRVYAVVPEQLAHDWVMLTKRQQAEVLDHVHGLAEHNRSVLADLQSSDGGQR
jgi:transcriptional regulator with XRE-family HTH domain